MADPKEATDGNDTIPQTSDPMPEEVEQVAVMSDETPPVKQPAPQSAPPKRQSSGLLGTVLGGVIAVGLGFGLAQVVPQGWPFAVTGSDTSVIAGMQTEIAALTARLDAESTQAPAVPTDLLDRFSALEAEVAKISARPVAQADLSGVEAEIADLRQALSDVQMEPAGISAAAEAEMQAKVADAAAEVEKAQAASAALKAASARTTALADLGSALEAGASLGDSLTALEAAGITPPAVLVENAAGVASLAALQSEFPEQARVALEASLRSDMGDTTTDRIASFLQSQLGARSLEPREGADADAVLSRIEGALRQGDLQGAVMMVTELPAAGQAALTDWVAKAQTNLAASDALAALAKAE